MKGSSLWAQVADLVREGKTPQVQLPRGGKVITPKRPVGRPRTNPVGASKHYGYALRTPAGFAMRCRAPRCVKTLKKGATSIVCSDACESVLREYCALTLEILDGRMPAVEYPTHFRSCRLSRR